MCFLPAAGFAPTFAFFNACLPAGVINLPLPLLLNIHPHGLAKRTVVAGQLGILRRREVKQDEPLLKRVFAGVSEE